MRIFVAGASGAIGRLLVPMLVAAGHDVTGTARTPAGVAEISRHGATGVTVDALDAEALTEVVAAARPDVVMHQLTALKDVNFADNSTLRRIGGRNVVAAAKAAGASRVIVQSISWACEPGEDPAGEASPLDTTAPEPRARLVSAVRALESAAAEMDDYVILRYGLFYGPGTWYWPGGRVDQQLRVGELVADDGVSSFVHVRDAALAAALALDWPAGIVNVVDDEPAAARDWIPVLAAAFGAPAPPVAVPGRQGWERGASNALARTRLGWQPSFPTWRTGFPALREANPSKSP